MSLCVITYLYKNQYLRYLALSATAYIDDGVDPNGGYLVPITKEPAIYMDVIEDFAQSPIPVDGIYETTEAYDANLAKSYGC